MVWNEIDWLLVFSQKNVKVLLSWLKFIYEKVLKMHGPKSKFIMKVVQVSKQEEFSKGGRRFLKLKKMGGDEGTILKHKVKARDKNHLTNKKPILDIMSQDRIPILWIETKQAKILDLLREPNFKCIKSSQKLGRVTAVYGWIPDYKQRV